MINIRSIHLHDPQWVPQSSNSEELKWLNGRGDKLYLQLFHLVPNIPASLDEPALIWSHTRTQAFWQQAAPVYLRVTTLQGLPCLLMITKFLFHTRPVYQGTLIIPRRDFSFTFIIQCPGESSDRDEYVRQEYLKRSLGQEEFLELWLRDPFSFEVVSPISKTASDDEEWDERFPSHPLSRVRSCMNNLLDNCVIEEEVVLSAPFLGPENTTDLQADLKNFVQVFVVSDAEKRSSLLKGKELTAFLEVLISKSQCDTSTEALTATKPVYALSDPDEFLRQFQDRPVSPARPFSNEMTPYIRARNSEEKLCLVQRYIDFLVVRMRLSVSA